MNDTDQVFLALLTNLQNRFKQNLTVNKSKWAASRVCDGTTPTYASLFNNGHFLANITMSVNAHTLIVHLGIVEDQETYDLRDPQSCDNLAAKIQEMIDISTKNQNKFNRSLAFLKEVETP